MKLPSQNLLLSLSLSASLAGCIADDEKPLDPKDEVPAEGAVADGMDEVDDVIKKFMRATCTGAAAVTIGFNNDPLLSRGYGWSAGAPTENCGAMDGDSYFGDAVEPIHADTPFRVGSNTKAITAAVMRVVVKQRLAEQGKPTDDEYLESLEVFDEANDLVSPALRRAILGNLAPSPGSCVLPEYGDSRVIASGRTDPRVVDITLGHILGHKSGFPRGGNPVYHKLSAIRGHASAADVVAEEAALDAPGYATTTLDDAVPGAHFMQRQTLEEYLIGNRDLCLNFNPGGDVPGGVDNYSNFAYGIVQHVAEYVSGRSYAANQGEDDHADSLLAQFNDAYLGFDEGVESQYGIYHSQSLILQRDPAEPQYRAWDGESRVGEYADDKRPYCVWDEDAGACDASAFLDEDVRFSWGWSKDEKVHTSFAGDGFSPGPGLIAAEMPLYYRFMQEFYVGGGGNNPTYGRPRAETPVTKTRWHIGELLGAHSTVAQFAGDTISYYVIPRDDDGELILDALDEDDGSDPDGELDLAAFDTILPTDSCKLPKGLNLAMAINQVNDETCGAGTICSLRYMALRDVVKEALCNVDWLKVNPSVTLDD
ncbi:MAG TPA: serine hydrolase domain-containing protein [Kofleriaceae bacterium]|nr:serine hydrolase domain-containing protein [Kofleriaceae bacterium]